MQGVVTLVNVGGSVGSGEFLNAGKDRFALLLAGAGLVGGHQRDESSSAGHVRVLHLLTS